MKTISFLPLLLALFVNFGFSQNKDFRKNVDIINYQIHLNITDFENKTISGYANIKLSPRTDELKNIILELHQLKTDSVFIFNEKITDFSYDGTLLNIPFEQRKEESNCCTQLTIYYHGKPQKDPAWGGFFFTDSSAYNIGVGMQAKPVSFGRAWFPCIDDFSEKASFDFFITAPASHKAVCSGAFVSKTKKTKNTYTWHWTQKKEVPPYLVSIAVDKYDEVKSVYEGIKRNVPISLFVYPEDVAKAKVSFSNLNKALQIYETNFGEYVWNRVGYVEVPFNSGAMEHVCNIAYPEYAIDSTLSRETLMAHELSHHWFGNLVSCKTPGDMWMNEGWAKYCEALFKEGVYGKDAYKDYARENHVKVLSEAHIFDDGYLPVYGIPHDKTYGTTVYYKGADVVRTLRAFLGDELFFKSISAYLQKYAFKSVSTHEFQDFLEKYTQMPVKDFFDTWVFTEGFPHFSLGNFSLARNADKYRCDFSIKQRLKERNFYGNNHKIELLFVDENCDTLQKSVNMSGTEEHYSFIFDTKPVSIFIDPEEKIADATVDNYKMFQDTASYGFKFTDFSIYINKLNGKAMVQSTINHISPLNAAQDKYIISKEKYWDIKAAVKGEINAEGSFYLNSDELDLDGDFEDLVLLYRPNETARFKKVKVKKYQYDAVQGIFIVKKLKFGQYAAGIKK